MQSEAGAVGAVHGPLGSGALTTTTPLQGLLLSCFQTCTRLPASSSFISTQPLQLHALNICDHLDRRYVRARAVTGFCTSRKKATSFPGGYDLAPAVHPRSKSAARFHLLISTVSGTLTRFVKVAVWDCADLVEMCDMDAVRVFRAITHWNPEHPSSRGFTNGDIFFQDTARYA